MNVVQLLEAAKEKINTPEKWCQHVYARSADGRSADYRTDDACAFCLDGAIQAARFSIGNVKYGVYDEAWRLLERANNGWNPISFNDAFGTTHADVMRVMDKAIALAKQEAAA